MKLKIIYEQQKTFVRNKEIYDKFQELRKFNSTPEILEFLAHKYNLNSATIYKIVYDKKKYKEPEK